jgi:ParB-like chromosome segregation protein Spo0J
MAKKKDDAKRVEFKWMAVGDLLPYARNVNQHSQEQINEVAASIKEFGCLAPLVIDEDNMVLAGHCRLAAAHKLMLPEVPVVRASHLSETQRRAYILADNKLAKKATTDEAMLRVEMIELRDAGFELPLLGYTEVEISGILDVPSMPDGELTQGRDIEGSKELDEGDFAEFQCTCPRCGFGFDAKKGA